MLLALNLNEHPIYADMQNMLSAPWYGFINLAAYPLKQRAPPDAVRREKPRQGPQNELFAAI